MPTKIITIKELADFLNEANKHTYAADGKKTTSSRLNSNDLEYQKGDLIYHDTYFGAKNFIGEEIIYKNKIPVWGMNYYGFVLDKNYTEKQVYDFLKKALIQECGELIPVRGPRTYKDHDLQYKNMPTGKLDNFSGKEEVLVKNRAIYRCLYHGGLVK